MWLSKILIQNFINSFIDSTMLFSINNFINIGNNMGGQEKQALCRM